MAGPSGSKEGGEKGSGSRHTLNIEPSSFDMDRIWVVTGRKKPRIIPGFVCTLFEGKKKKQITQFLYQIIAVLYLTLSKS